MKSKKPVIGLAAAIAVGVLWYLFRPELLFVNAKVNDKFPVAAAEQTSERATEPVLLSQGDFHSVAHESKGTAAIYQIADDKRVLRFTGFETSNGPDVHVYLVAADDAKDSDTVKQAGFVEIGSLKGNIGDQNYDLPADLDLAKYRAVTIWCQRFGVNFGTAPLTPLGKAAPTATQPVAVATGNFHKVAHESKGTATIYQLADGKRVLRFTEFETSNGPDVHVYLVAADDANDSDTVKQAGFVEIGSLKGNIGDQNYDLPSDLDLAKYRAVTIWCQRFGVNFGTAPLATAEK